MTKSFKERLHKGYAQSMELKGKPIAEEKSRFQRIRIFDTVANGRVMTLDDTGCLCTTMYRISPQHLAWALENLIDGRVVNRIKVDEDVKHWAKVALDRMLEVGIPVHKARPAEAPAPEAAQRSA